MPGFIQRLVGSTKRHARRGQKERRTEALYDAALRLLAKHDFEKISIATIAREAGCSVGAFYSRFPDKNAFLQSVISVAFHTLTAEAAHDLDRGRWHGNPRDKTIAELIRHVVTQMSRDQAAGALRAALKLSNIKPDAAEPLLRYRAAVTNHAIALLAPRPSPSSATAAVRTAVQVVFATVIDAALQKAGPLRLGSRQTIEALADLMTAYLKLASKGSAADRESNKEEASKPASKRSAAWRVRPDESEGRNALLSPEVREIARMPVKVRPQHAPPGRSHEVAKPPAQVNPRSAKEPASGEASTRAGRGGKRRFRLL